MSDTLQSARIQRVQRDQSARTTAVASSQSHRLAQGGLIDRAKPLNFTFDGRTMTGFGGDTLASALIANGVTLTGRSFKYHRPRGILTAGSEEPNALVELRGGARREPNTRATITELHDGLEADSQNRWPSLRHDVMAVNSLLSPLFVAGFYYKTFMWPASFWERLYEPAIRRAAGLGKPSGAADPDQYDKAWAHCDVLVIGSGPAGLSAAIAAGRTGARVILCEEDSRAGGRLLSETGEIDNLPLRSWLDRSLVELASLPNVQVMTRTAVFGVYDGGVYGALERVNDHVAVPPVHQVRQRLWRIIAKRSVLAAGAYERPIVFPANDRPGVMMASAVRTYLERFAAVPGRRLALFTNNDDGWRTVETALRVGVDVVAVIDPRQDVAERHRTLAKKADIHLLTGVVGTVSGGASGIRRIVVTAPGKTEPIVADTLAISGGWNPAIGLSCAHRGRPVWREDIAAFVPGPCPPGMVVAGAANGTFGLGSCLRDGQAAGVAAASECGHVRAAGAAPQSHDEGFAIVPLWRVAGRGKAFVDLQHDVTASDVELAHREGFRSVEHLKRYTTLGMATDQGRTSNVNGLAIMADVSGRSIETTGTTIYRPPASPVTVAALAGRNRGRCFHAVRLTPSHHWAAEQGAVFVDAGLWKRPQWFPRPGETDWLQSVTREVLAVRNGVGFCDVSTLGKIDVIGRDAGAFLDRVYINTFSTLGVGKARYGIMLREDGIVMDDGTTSRLAEDHYFVTTTTGKAAPVMQHLEFCRQVLWPELDVQLSSATDQWAQFSVAGPMTRKLLTAIVEPHEDLSNAAFPFMAVREVTLRGNMTARLFRLSFSGELAFEIAVPARYGDALARNLMIAGRSMGVTPYGTEALGVMRIEKGHVSAPELNGTTTAGDLGFSKMMSGKKDYVGRVMANRDALVAPDREVLVGLKPLDPARRLRAGAHVVPKGAAPSPATDHGYVTSACFSPVLGQWIGLGLVSRGRDRLGEVATVHDPLRSDSLDATICTPVFYDPQGGRQRA